VSAPIVELGVTSPLVSVDRITPFFRFGPGKNRKYKDSFNHYHSSSLSHFKTRCWIISAVRDVKMQRLWDDLASKNAATSGLILPDKAR